MVDPTMEMWATKRDNSLRGEGINSSVFTMLPLRYLLNTHLEMTGGTWLYESRVGGGV